MEGEGMTDAEVAAHIRRWCEKEHRPFSWPTDGCSYEQHIRFVKARNREWIGKSLSRRMTWKEFILDYADRLERGEIAEVRQ